MTFGERLTELRKEHGYATRSDFAKYLGIPSTTLRNYEQNAREPGHTFLKQISSIFNVSIDYLLCLTDDRETLTQFPVTVKEQNMIIKYRKIDEHGKKIVDLLLNEEYDRCQQESFTE